VKEFTFDNPFEKTDITTPNSMIVLSISMSLPSSSFALPRLKQARKDTIISHSCDVWTGVVSYEKGNEMVAGLTISLATDFPTQIL